MAHAACPLRVIAPDQLYAEISQHRLWTRTRGQKGEPADFSAADLSGLNLNHCQLSGVRFDGARCVGTNFRASKLDNCSFVGAYCVAAIFEFASANFSDCRAASFYNARVTGTNWMGANFIGANTSGWHLASTSLDGAVGVLGTCLIKTRQSASFLLGRFGIKNRDDVFLQDGGRDYGLRVLWDSHDFSVEDTIEYCTNPNRRPVPQVSFPRWAREHLPAAVYELLARACRCNDADSTTWVGAKVAMARIGAELQHGATPTRSASVVRAERHSSVRSPS